MNFDERMTQLKENKHYENTEHFGIPPKLRTMITICIEVARCKVKFG